MTTAAITLGKRVYRSYWQDGSLDLVSGLAVALIGVSWLVGMVPLGAVAPAIAIPMWMSLRAKLVAPRLGEVTFDSKRRSSTRRAFGVLLLVGAGALALAIALFMHQRRAGQPADWVQAVVPALPSALIGLGAILAAALLDLGRIAVYGAVSIVFGALAALLGIDPGWSIFASGVVAALAGGVMLVRFVKTFPPLPAEME